MAEIEARELACLRYPDLFASDAVEDVDDCRTACVQCPRKVKCARAVLDLSEQPSGTWAGLSRASREKIRALTVEQKILDGM